jgi:hypothetical protein
MGEADNQRIYSLSGLDGHVGWSLSRHNGYVYMYKVLMSPAFVIEGINSYNNSFAFKIVVTDKISL